MKITLSARRASWPRSAAQAEEKVFGPVEVVVMLATVFGVAVLVGIGLGQIGVWLLS